MPTLGDWEILKVDGTETPEAMKAGLCDDFWRKKP